MLGAMAGNWCGVEGEGEDRGYRGLGFRATGGGASRHFFLLFPANSVCWSCLLGLAFPGLGTWGKTGHIAIIHISKGPFGSCTNSVVCSVKKTLLFVFISEKKLDLS
jgi:hypothetical protein